MDERIPIYEAEKAILARLGRCRTGCFNRASEFIQQAQLLDVMTRGQYDYACGLVLSYRKQMYPIRAGGSRNGRD